jgi:16S rRNA A1518/A1519 N6-dimethyltransferase RsmA/KsgA/DIM1 with predicted DNA glycosylase/AP lyase activity
MVAGGNSAELRYELWNKWKGVDFEFVSVEELGLPQDRAHFHSSSGGPVLARVFKTIEIAPGSVALDLGSGKGAAVLTLTLSRLGFAEVVGVELARDLIDVAQQNATKLGRRNVRFVQGDAAAFRDYDRVTHVYMYNPFPCSVMSEVIANLDASLKRVPHSLTIVYRNAECHQRIVESGLFEVEPEQRFDGHAWRIYRSCRP